MSKLNTGKARLVGCIIGLLALWPIAHRQLVTRYDTNPWKLYGFAMYCTPHTVHIELHGRTAAGRGRLATERLPLEARRAYAHFEHERRTLGRLHPPDALARVVLDALPQLQRLEVLVRVWQLPPGDDTLRARVTSYTFER